MKTILSLITVAAISTFAAACGASQTKVAEKSNDATIKPGDNASAKSNSATDAVKIKVGKNGFEPSEIKVEKGKPAKIAFTRIDEQNCASEVVFPKLNITRKLPVGETVVVEINPQDAGEISFACGMGMMKGKILAQ